MKFRVTLKAFDNELMKLACIQLHEILVKTECKLEGLVALPIKIKRFCVLRSPHIDKDSREHFELRTYKRIMDIATNSSSVFDALLRTELPSPIVCSLKVLTTGEEKEEEEFEYNYGTYYRNLAADDLRIAEEKARNEALKS